MPPMGRSLSAIAVAGLAVAVGVYSLAVARGDPSHSFAGASAAGAVALLGAGWTLVAFALLLRLGMPGSRFGPLLAATGFAWFLAEWNNPGIGSALAFTIGLCLYASCPAVAGHAVL